MSDATSAIRKSYTATNQLLGQGSYGKVFLFKSKDEKKDYAVKVMLKEFMSKRVIDMIREEILVLSMMDHPNIIKYVESFEDQRYMYIITEYVAHSRDLSDILFEAFESKEETALLLPIEDVKKLMKMILQGVSHMHAN